MQSLERRGEWDGSKEAGPSLQPSSRLAPEQDDAPMPSSPALETRQVDDAARAQEGRSAPTARPVST
jgi:hypothetical protein